MLGKGPHLENAIATAFDNRAYCVKGRDAWFESGKMGDCVRPNNREQRIEAFAAQAPVGGRASAQVREDALKEAFEECKSISQFRRLYPELYARNCHGVAQIYRARIAESPCERPVIEWRFGETRSGKTYAGLESVGGKDNENVFYQEGNMTWIKGEYEGQQIFFLNEFRKSTMEAFVSLLSMMEGFPAQFAVKGGFTHLRLKKVIITCPRPPKGMNIMMAQGLKFYRGEFDYVDKYGANHEMLEHEDVGQVIERIRESGGALIHHYVVYEDGKKVYRQQDVTFERGSPEDQERQLMLQQASEAAARDILEQARKQGAEETEELEEE